MWAHIINAALGIWMMAAPAVLGYGDPAQVNDRIAGPLIAMFAVIAWWEATRPVGRWNLALGLWLCIAPWLLGYEAAAPRIQSLLVGLIVAGLSLVTGTVKKRYGGGWSALWNEERLAEAD